MNRLLTRFLGEVIAAVDEGTPLEVADRALDPLGLPMRPLALLQLVGPAVGAARRRDAARGLPGPVRRQRQPAPDRRGKPGLPLMVDDKIDPEVVGCSRSATRR